MLEKLTTPDELSGFLNLALDGLKNLLKNGDFSNSQSINEVREEYIRKSDSVAAFVMDCILIAPDDYVKKKELYTNYADYCRNKNYPVVPENTFHKDLQKKIRVEDYQPRLEDEKGGKTIRPHCWRGIKLDLNILNSYSLNRKKPVPSVPPVPKEKGMEQGEQEAQVKLHLSSSGKKGLYSIVYRKRNIYIVANITNIIKHL